MTVINCLLEVRNFLSLVCLVAVLPFFDLAVSKALRGVRLGDFPPPDFKRTIKAVASQSAKNSFKRIILPSRFKSVPDLVRVYASAEDGDSSGFRFEGTGACQNSGSSGNYGGVIFAYNSKELYLWAPTKYSGNTNGKLIYVEDGWGGEKYTQSSRVADVTIEAWNSLPTPNFHAEIQVDDSRRFYEVPHKLKQIPDFISVRVYSRLSGIFKKDLSFHFHATGAAQTPSGSVEYGGIIFAYNETFVRLWLPKQGDGLRTGCIFITRGWGNGKYARQMNSNVCQVEIRAWINSFPLPVFQTSWKGIRANAHKKSFREIKHNIGSDSLLVQVQVKREGSSSEHFIYDGLGSIQSTQSSNGAYGGILFAYDKMRVRIWVASSEIGEKGRAIFVSDAWGNGSHVEEHDRALFRIRIYANVCKNRMQIVDGQGGCRDAGQTGLVWQASNWGNCSKICSKGTQSKKLTGCHAINLQTVFSCDFEQNDCRFTSSHKWEVSKGSAEKELEPDGYTQPPYGFSKGSRFIYSVVRNEEGGALVQLTSPEFPTRKNCILRFLYNTGVYYNYLEADVRSPIGWYQAWKISDKQPGDPYIWYSGYLNLESYDVKQFRFNLRLRAPCQKHCGYVAFDEITLQCEAEEDTLLPLETCEKRLTALPGCGIDVLQPLYEGRAFSIVHSHGGKYVRANGSLSQHIATYRFKVEKEDNYTIWIEALGTSFKDNSVSFYIDDNRQRTVHLVVFLKETAWIWNCLNKKGIRLKSGIHQIALKQYDPGFTYRTIIVAPKRITTWSSLGMQNMHINDMQLKSSLKLGDENAPHLRLNGKGSWETKDANFGWIHWQINFPDVALVSRIAIQGACHMSGSVRCCGVEKFQLKFSIDGTDFIFYKNSSGKTQFFPGSNKRAPNQVVESELEYVVPARAVRIYPYNDISYTCMRVEAYGAYITKPMCTHAGIKPTLRRNCIGSRDCGKNSECVRTTDTKGNSEESCRCSPGYHGQFCEHVGCDPNPCRNNGVCKIHNNIFKCSCPPGFTEKLCQMPCPSNKYGLDCKQTCHCPQKSRCHPVTGRCICEPGFTGQLCDTPCASGYFGQDCKRTCRCSASTVCDSISGSCYCRTGFYGESCEHPCKIGFYGRNCSIPCQCAKQSKCLPSDGTCICPLGWYGKFCDKECPDNKFGPYCKFNCSCPGNSVCNKRNGRCSCKEGWRGDKCNSSCPDKKFGLGCNFNCSCDWGKTIHCDHVTGQCLCKDGFIGSKCKNRCKHGTYGPGCSKQCKCRNDAYCDPKDGRCRCHDGFMGKLCQTACSKGRYGKNCIKKCGCIANNTQVCSNVDGTCDCLPGFKGRRCHKLCKPGFWGKNCNFNCHCHHGSHCDRMIGICTCTAGWVGETCDTPCDNGFYGPGCKFACKCQNGATCNRFNGNCTCTSGFIGQYCGDECLLWRYGNNCKQECSCQQNFSNGCSNVNGTCFCKAGYRGENCEEDCPDGKYGMNCKLDCQQCPYHSAGPCDKKTGRCNCSLGYFGDLCQDPCPLDSYGHLCSSSCQCTGKEICNNINGECLSRNQFEFFTNIQAGANTIVSTDFFAKFATNLEKLMAKYYVSYLQPLSRKEREISVSSVSPETGPDFGQIASAADVIGREKRTDEDDTLVSRLIEEDKENSIDSFLHQAVDGYDISNKSLFLDGRSNRRNSADREILEDGMLVETKNFPGGQIPNEVDIQNGTTDSLEHRIMRRDVLGENNTLSCISLSSPLNFDAFSVRVISKEKKFDDNGNIVFTIGLMALYKSKPQSKQLMEKFLKSLPSDCLLIGTSCSPCSVYWDSLNDGKQPTESSFNTWIIIGCASGVFVLCMALAVYLILQRKRQSIVPTIYKAKKNSRDIELRPCLANGDGGHVLAFENPYYDVIAAMGLDDDIEEDYYNPLYTYDDVSLYCDDQASDSGTETNNEDGYQYPYDRDSGISSGTIHQ